MRQTTRPRAMVGGLDLSTAPIICPPGRAIAMKNYEGVPRGYGRIAGIERFDGQPKPSLADYWVLNFTGGTAAITAGQVVTGAMSGATGKALVDAVVTSGTYGGANAAGYLVLTVVTGTYVTLENLQVAAATKSAANGAAIQDGALTDANDTTWKRLAVDQARALIAAIPGSGNVLGAWAYKGVKYGFRNAIGGATAAIYKSSAAGWVLVPLGFTLAFTAGGTGYTPVVGDVIVGATSAATGTITGIVITSGSIAAGTAVGYFTLLTATGVFGVENLNIGAHVTVAHVAADKVAITLSPNGRYDFVNHNFGGSTSTYMMYGVDGVNKGFQFDGTTYIPITTGMTVDTPKHLAVHYNTLFYAFPKGSLQFSGTTLPLSWTVITGAGEIGLGEEITGFQQYTQSTISGAVTGLAVFGRNAISILYGSDPTTFSLTPMSTQAGAIEWTSQTVASGPIYVDDIGVRDIRFAKSYGNSNSGTLSQLVSPIFTANKTNGVTPVASVRSKAKDQYRLFFSDNSYLSLYFGRMVNKTLPESYVGDLGILVTCASASEETETGSEIVLIGDSNGFVYQMDAGTSFDGVSVEAYLSTAYDNDGRPTLDKAWKQAMVELDAAPTATISGSAEFDYGDPEGVPSYGQDFSVAAGGGIWDASFWDKFYWDSPTVGKAKLDIEGQGANCSVSLYSNQIYEAPHVLHGITLQYSQRGLIR